MTGFLYVVFLLFGLFIIFYVFPLIKEIVPTNYSFMTEKEPFLWNHGYYYYITLIVELQFFLTDRCDVKLSKSTGAKSSLTETLRERNLLFS